MVEIILKPQTITLRLAMVLLALVALVAEFAPEISAKSIVVPTLVLVIILGILDIRRVVSSSTLRHSQTK